MTAPQTPPATPTPEGLARALTMLDAATETLGARSFYVVQGDAWLTAVFAVARAAVASHAAWDALYDPDAGDVRDRDRDVDVADAALAAAVARLCALATGAQAGEGVGGS